MKFIPITAVLLFLLSSSLQAASVTAADSDGKPLATVMVSRYLVDKPELDLSDDGYPQNGVTNQAAVEHTLFTNAAGSVNFSDIEHTVRYRLRATGYADSNVTGVAGAVAQSIVMHPLGKEQLPESYPANVWLSALDFNGDEELKRQFQLNCAFCHQQGSVFMRSHRSAEEWLQIIQRMAGYGARIADTDQQQLAEVLSREYDELNQHPERVPAPLAWQPQLSGVEMTEWPIGDAFSQMHDFLVHPNGRVYVGDNLQDRIFEVDPDSGAYIVHKVPHDEGSRVGGILGNRFSTYGKIYNFLGVHSFAHSKTDGHIFITPSMQQALLEFDPVSHTFTQHALPEGYYPHTIRSDDQDRIWFTLALSSQVGMWDRKKREFTFYDLPARGFKEWLILKSLPLLFWFEPENRPTPAVDRESTGVPMPYGIDVAPNGIVWFTRLYADDIGFINPDDGTVTMIKTPFAGPRRLRVDADNNVWIVAFQDSKLARYEPDEQRFTLFELPLANELPYALNVDRERGKVWVNGNQSDTVLRFDIATEDWRVYPLPRKRFFSRDIEFDERDGTVYTTNSHFPSWQIEDAQPTLLRIRETE
jgi:virginiamycin B lyase